MLGSIYKGMAGMLAYSKGLNNVSGNVANMNTTGYKRTELHFRELVYDKNLSDSSGFRNSGAAGVDASLKSTVYSQGELSETGNDTDMAIDGAGFFILQDDRNQYYTRVGQFDFDKDGYLVDKTYGFQVAGLSDNNALRSINLKGFRSTNPQATNNISLVGNLSIGSSSHLIEDVDVYDAEGAVHTLSIEFTNNGAETTRSWLVSVINSDGELLADELEVRFNENGSPAEDFNSIPFSVTSDNETVTEILLDLGDPESFSQVTNFSSGATSSAEIDSVDGYAPGIMTSFDINDLGEIEADYSNEQSAIVAQIALARFESPDDLIQKGQGLLSSQPFQSAIIGASTSLGLGSIAGGTIELSNVDLTDQFTDMIVLQRGYQASSQVLTSSNEMLQQLMEATKSR